MRVPQTVRQKSTDWVLQFINIVFLLLMYFLANGSIIEQQHVGIDLPISVVQGAGPPPQDALYLDQAGSAFYRNNPVSLTQFAAARIEGIPAGQPALTIVADRRLSANALVATVSALKNQGIADISVVTVREAGS